MTITAGTKLGRYEIRSKLGEGGISRGEQDWQQIKPSFKDSLKTADNPRL